MNPVRENITLTNFLLGKIMKDKYMENASSLLFKKAKDDELMWKSADDLLKFPYWPVKETLDSNLSDFYSDLKLHKMILGKKSERICYVITLLQIKIKRFQLDIKVEFGMIDPEMKELDDELLDLYIEVEMITSKNFLETKNKVFAESTLFFSKMIHNRIVMKWLLKNMSYKDSRIDVYASKIKTLKA